MSPCRRNLSDVFVVLVLIAITIFSTYSYYVYIFPCTLQVIGNALTHPFSRIDSTADIFVTCPALLSKEATNVIIMENTSRQMSTIPFYSVSDALKGNTIYNSSSYYDYSSSPLHHNGDEDNVDDDMHTINISTHEKHNLNTALQDKLVVNKEADSRIETENEMYIHLLTRVNGWSYVLLVISTVLLVMWYWSYVEAVMTAPGDVPPVFAQRKENSSTLALLTFYEPLPFYTPIALLRRAYRYNKRRHQQRRIREHINNHNNNNNNINSSDENLLTDTSIRKQSSPKEEQTNAKWHTKYKMIACSGDSENDTDEQHGQSHAPLHENDAIHKERINSLDQEKVSHDAVAMPSRVECGVARNVHISPTDTRAMSTPVMRITNRSDTATVHATSQLDCNTKNETDVPEWDNFNTHQYTHQAHNLSKQIGAYPPLPRHMRPTKIRSFPTPSSSTIDTNNKNSSDSKVVATSVQKNKNDAQEISSDEYACKSDERSHIIKDNINGSDQKKRMESVQQRRESDEYTTGEEGNNMEITDAQPNSSEYITTTIKDSSSEHANETATDKKDWGDTNIITTNSAAAVNDDDHNSNNRSANPYRRFLHHNHHYLSKRKEQFFFNPYANSYTSVLNNYLNLCPVCATYKPPRAHHCSRCNRCILRYDHHCPWIGQCVGFFNLKNYLLLLFYSSLAGMWILLQLTIAFAAYFLKLENFSARALVNPYTGTNQNVFFSTNESLAPSHLHSSKHGLAYCALRHFDLLVNELNVGPPTIGVFICYGECLAFTIMCTYLLLRYIFYVRHNIATIDVVIHESTLAFSHQHKHIESDMSTADDTYVDNNNISSSSDSTNNSDDDNSERNIDKLDESFSSSTSSMSSSMSPSLHAEMHRHYHSHHVAIKIEPTQQSEMTASRKFIAFLSSRGCTVDDERRFGAKNMRQFMKRNVYDVGVKRNLLQVFGDGVYVDETENVLAFHEKQNAEVNDHTNTHGSEHNDNEHFFRDKMEGNECIHRNFCIRWLCRLTPFPAYPRQLLWPSAQLRSGPFTHIAPSNNVNNKLPIRQRWAWPFSAHRNDDQNFSNTNTIELNNRAINEQTTLYNNNDDMNAVQDGYRREYGSTQDNRANRLSYPHAIKNYNLLLQLNIDERHLLGLRFPTRRSLGL